MSYFIQLSLFLSIFIFERVICQCDVKCLSCSDGICQQCMDGYTYNQSNYSCQSTCQYNTYRDDTTGTCQSVCPTSYYNNNNLYSCIQYPNCPNLIEKGQNHFDLVTAAAVTQKLIFAIGIVNNKPVMSNNIKVYSRDAELQGQLVGHSNSIIGIQSITVQNIVQLYSYSSTELILWDVNLCQMIRYGLFDQNLQASSISYIDQDIIILQQDSQTFGVLQLSQFRNISQSYQSTLLANKQINTLTGFTRFQNNIYTFSQDGKLYSYNLNSLSDGLQIAAVSNPIQSAVVISQNNIIIIYGLNVLTYYNGYSSSVVDLGHTLTINKVLTDVDQTLKINYIFTFDAASFKFSYINSNNQIQVIDFRNIKKSFSKLMKSYLVTIDAYGQIIIYTYSNMILKETLTLNLSFKTYFAISDAYIGITSEQMYIFGTELFYLNLMVQKQQITLESRNKNIPIRMTQHTSKVNGIVFDRLYNRVITYSDDGSIIFYDQIGNQYKFVMQKFYPSTNCDMLQNTRCFVAVNDLQILRPNLYSTIYSNGSVILYKYSALSFDMIKQLTMIDTTLPILNTYFVGSLLVYCNGKEVRVYDVDQDLIVLIYAPVDALKNYFLHCATDQIGGVNYLIFSRIINTSYFIIATDTFQNLAIANYVIPSAQQYSVLRDIYIAQYFSSIKWYMVTNSQLYLYFSTFPNFKTTTISVYQNLPVSVAFDPNSRSFTVFSMNQYMSYYLYSSGSYVKQNTFQFAAFATGKQSTAISFPELYFSFQNTGVSTIQNQVFVMRPNLNFQLVLTFVDKISSINVDTVTKKLYIGFENGNIYNGNYLENYVLFQQQVNYNNFYYSDQSDLLFAYNKAISVIDSTQLQQTATLSDSNMISNLNGVLFIDSTQQLIAYNSDKNKNLVMWDIKSNTNQQFMNGHTTAGVVNAQLDIQNSLLISQGADFFIIIWNYLTLSQVYRIQDHVNAMNALNLSQASIPAAYQIQYQITLFIVDTINKVIVSANNLGTIFVHSYITFTSQSYNITSMTYVYVDNIYNHIIAASNNNFIYKLTILSYTSSSLTYFKDVTNVHTEQILGALIQNNNVYSFEETKIVVMDRQTLTVKNTIVCVNPLITNFIVYEKLNQVIIWSDAQTSILNQSIGIYNLLTGAKIQDINNNQVIEQGNIHKLIVDQDTNQLIISKVYTYNYIYTIDLQTFYYSGYYTQSYTGYIKQWQFIPRTNRLIYIDSASPSNLQIYNMEGSINLIKKFQLISDEKNANTLFNQQTQNIYYFDSLNQSWKYDRNQQKLTFLNNNDQIKASKFFQDYFYVITASQVLKYTSDLLLISSFNFQTYQCFFTNLYLYLLDFNYNFIQLALTSFVQLPFQRQLENTIKYFLPNENYQDVVIMLVTQKVYRFNMQSGNTIYSNSQVQNLQMIAMDSNNQIIIYIFYPQTINFYSYQQKVQDYTQNLLQTINNGFSIFNVMLDYQQNTFITISIYDVAPIIRIYSYVFNQNSLQPITLISSIPSPSRSPNQKIDLSDPTKLSIVLPWQIINYDRITYKFVSYFRDTQVIYSLINQGTLNGFPSLLNSVQSDSIQLYSQVNNVFAQPSLFKFPLSYPVVLSYTINRKSIYYQIQIAGISTQFIFDYSFQIPTSQNTQFNNCFQNINGTFKYTVDMQMMTLQNSINKLNFNLSSSLIQVDAQNAFFYHSLMTSYNASVIYQNYSSNPPTVKVTSNLFSNIGLDQIIIDNYVLDISNGGQIKLNTNANRLVFKSIQIVGNSQNFSFLFTNLQSVIIENILINNLILSGSTVLFNITSCQSVYIKNFRVRSLSLGNNAQLFYIRSISQQLLIENMSINYLSVDYLQQQNFVIGLINIAMAQIINSHFSQYVAINSQKPFYFISLQGIQQLTISNVQYTDSIAFGFIQYKNYYRDNQQIVYLHNDVFQIKSSQFNNHFYLNSPFISIEGNSITFNHTQFQYIECFTCSGTVISLISVQSQFLVVFSIFNNTVGEQGGAIAFLNNLNVSLTIQDSTFLNCTAQASGGAIFLSSSDLLLNRTTIQLCQAQIGGGIRYIGLEPIFIYYQRKYLSQKDKNFFISNDISNNYASIYGQNVGSYPKMIKIIAQTNLSQQTYNNSLDTDTFNLDLYLLQNFQSGADISFQFQILDQDSNPIFFDLSALQNNYYPDSIIQEIQQFSIKALPGNDNIKVFGQYITDYTQFNLDTKTFTITSMLIIGQPSSTNYILFESPSIQKILNPDTDRDFNAGPFHIRLNIQFRKCLRGEVYKLSGSIFYCQECKEGTYSIVQPIQDDYDTQLCLRCPDEASYCYRDQMELKSGYWKYSNDTDQIVYCSNQPENCNGDQLHDYCVEGHIGPQCEQCDIYGNMWEAEYQSDGKFSCINCTELRQPKYLFPMIFIALGMVIYIILSVHIAYEINTLIVQGYYLRQLNLLSINKSAYQDTTNMNIKAMVNYMQISSMVNTFVVQLPSWMTFIPDYFGSPIQNMLHTFDCYLNKAQQSKYPIVFLRTLWSLAIPIFYLLGAGVIYFILVKLKLFKYRQSYIISGLVFLCFFTQPNMVSDLLGVMSCRDIDGKLYISSDISYECYTQIHVIYIGIVCIPGLILWGLMIPAFIIRLLVSNKEYLDHATIRLKYGFLYQDYKNSRYYWEFLKMYKKLFAVAVLSFYGNPYTNKLVIILVVYLLYLVALLRFRPYQMQYFQKIDRASMIVTIVILLMNIFLYNKPDMVQQELFYVIIIILHNSYQFFLLLEVCRAKISVIYRVRYNQFLKWLVTKIPFLKPYIVINQRTSMKTFHLWMKITYYINEYAERKQYNEIDQVNLIGSMSQSKELHNQSFLPSKRNRIRMQNSNTLQPLKGGQIQQSIRLDNHNPIQDDYSQRHSFQKDQLLSADRLDPHFLSPKGSSNNLLFLSARKDETFKSNGNYIEFDDILLSPSRNTLLQSPVSSLRQDKSELNHYGEIEEAEDERRLIKKKGINYDHNLYQKTDLIKKNLILIDTYFNNQVEQKFNQLQKVQEANIDAETPDIDESIELQKEVLVNSLRNTNTLAPRFQISQIQQEDKDFTPTPNQENAKQLIDLNESDDDEDAQQKQEKMEKKEEEEDYRRIQTKSQINHVLNVQRKTNIIYKNLKKVECSDLNCLQNSNSNEKQNENILETEEDSSKPQDQNLVQKQKSFQNQQSLESISQIDSMSSKQIIDPSQKDIKNVIQARPNALLGSPQIEKIVERNNSLSQNFLLPQQSLQKQETEISMSKEIQNIIQNKAITAEKMIKEIHD
ncbi:transmembrane protein, putative (macronuclear) [Tetrahymena thermophila SB210]|uniref:Transmembrane protein, putative n=1 Tax=Tetrahymena thermophila (strain SB210) TaxID=312017 RepID=I7M183_TETTS|nr:transmembrane protein, putative [Tetrahymena thermophila SB210]EAR95682.3 transmembrane protein, putative [Tetrahymena thermophila SB210]|eukprot:XP_001015927.3 transmembrane protein, putative [Tetrahymena thermophila SB210]